jgi:hypothetical protein
MLVSIWSNNALLSSPKMHGIPIGVSAAPDMLAERNLTFATSWTPQDCLLFVNLGVDHDHHREYWFEYAKQHWQQFSVIVSAKDFHAACPKDVQSWYYAMLTRCSFTWSPPGAGWDCYRTWEALYFGSIPVILRSYGPLDEVYEGLPVLMLDSYEDVTEQLLKETLRSFRTTKFDLKKLTWSYWAQLIHASSPLPVNNADHERPQQSSLRASVGDDAASAALVMRGAEELQGTHNADSEHIGGQSSPSGCPDGMGPIMCEGECKEKAKAIGVPYRQAPEWGQGISPKCHHNTENAEWEGVYFNSDVLKEGEAPLCKEKKPSPPPHGPRFCRRDCECGDDLWASTCRQWDRNSDPLPR